MSAQNEGVGLSRGAMAEMGLSFGGCMKNASTYILNIQYSAVMWFLSQLPKASNMGQVFQKRNILVVVCICPDFIDVVGVTLSHFYSCSVACVMYVFTPYQIRILRRLFYIDLSPDSLLHSCF